jgi:MFS family permease
MLLGDQVMPLAISSAESTDNETPKLSPSKSSMHLSPTTQLFLLIVTKVVIYIEVGALAVRSMQSTIPLLHSQGFDMTQTQLGFVGSIFTVGILIGCPLSAHLAEAYHPFSIATVSQLVWICSSVMAAYQNYWVFLAARLLTVVKELTLQ